jgi:hypothetical protein
LVKWWQGLAWVGRNLVLCTSLRYLLWDPALKELKELLRLPEEAPSPTEVLPIPSAHAALLLMVRPFGGLLQKGSRGAVK